MRRQLRTFSVMTSCRTELCTIQLALEIHKLFRHSIHAPRYKRPSKAHTPTGEGKRKSKALLGTYAASSAEYIRINFQDSVFFSSRQGFLNIIANPQPGSIALLSTAVRSSGLGLF